MKSLTVDLIKVLWNKMLFIDRQKTESNKKANWVDHLFMTQQYIHVFLLYG